MNEKKPVEKAAVEPEPSSKTEEFRGQETRKRIKVESDIRAGFGSTQGNGHTYP